MEGGEKYMNDDDKKTEGGAADAKPAEEVKTEEAAK